MKQSHIYFKIDKMSAIIFELPQPLNKAFRYDEISIFLNQNNQNKYILYQDFFIAGLRDFESSISCALAGTLIHKEDEEDLGFLWNEKLDGKKLPMTIDNEDNKFWVGQKFILFDSPELLTTWLFEKNKQFWIEITPVYPWHHIDPKINEKFITYENFIKSYKPIEFFEISRETLEEWQKRVQELLATVEANDSKHINE